MPPTAFSSAIAGPMGQSLVAQLQEDDVTLHQQFQEFIQMRARADKKYAQQLMKIAAHFRPRGGSQSSVINDTQVYKAWQSLVTFTEQFAQAVLEESSTLQNQVKATLELLLQEKAELRRTFLQRKQQHESKLQQMDTAEAEQKAELLRAVKRTMEERQRFISSCQRRGSNPGPGDKSNCRDKYRSCLRRVHNAHNAYVLILEEANAHCQLFEATSLPKFLDLQQQLMQLQVEQSKLILHELYLRSSHSGEKFQKLISHTVDAISAIEPSTEFDTFLEANKSPCVATCLREYDDKLLENYQGNSLHAHRLILNELTNVNLEKSKRRYDTEKMKHTEMLSTRTKEAEKEKESIRTAKEEANMTESKRDDLRKRTKSHLIIVQSEVDEQCRVDMYSKLLNVVSRSIEEGKSAHSGNLPPVQELGESGDTNSLRGLNLNSSNKLWGKLRHTLSKSECKRPSVETDSEGIAKVQGPQGANGSAPGIADLPPKPPAKPPARERLISAPAETNNRVPELPARHQSVPGERTEAARSPQLARHANNSESEPVGAASNAPPAALPSSTTINHSSHRRELEKEPFFHGVLPRDEVQRLLREDGDFLVRESHNRRQRTGTSSDAPGSADRPFVLSVYWQGYKHFIVQGQAGSWHFEGSGFATIPELIEHHMVSGDKITGQSGAAISNPIARANWQLDNDDIQLGANIGRGNFGDVHVGWYNGKKVAVKTCREELPEEMRRRFLDEGKILLKYNHRNIVRLIGIAAQRQPIMIVMEYVANGSLLNYLKRSKDLSRHTRLKVCLDAANGMAYLESKNCIHRDLAARNCLVAEDLSIKIADFGMSREEEVYTVSEGLKQIPIKWTAPEALSTGHYTVKCDVWSYGVLMWEVYSKGSTPYHGLTNSQTREKVEAGDRMPAPEGTPSEVYDVMLRCWEAKPAERPSFGEIVAYLTRLHNDEMSGPETSLL